MNINDAMNKVVGPTVHMGGTSKQELLGALIAARHVLLDAMKAHQETAPHARDYPAINGRPHRAAARYMVAKRQYDCRIDKLRQVYSELTEIQANIIDQD